MHKFSQQLVEAKNRLNTIRDFIRFMISQFQEHNLSYGHGTDNAFDEAVYVTLATLNLPLDQLDPFMDAKLLDSEIDQLLNVCRKRVENNLPAPYITNEANFLGYKFYVDERVIIPRSYIGEIILNKQLDEYFEHPELVHNVLDLCTGNGSLAIIAADYFYDSQVIASDIDNNALEVAKINIEKHGLREHIKLFQSNLFEKLSNYQGKFDLIITNPPYVDTERMSILPKEYLHEPKISLDGGNDGLILVDSIIKHARQYLSAFGILVLEMGDNLEELKSKYHGLNFKWLSTSNDDGFVFVLTKKDLDSYYS
ncbi:MAG: 50S ribosomal protein L3 N(5)-glutamine methyltransferase [Neisseriaceae bacterium]